jgi:hypothetical protein
MSLIHSLKTAHKVRTQKTNTNLPLLSTLQMLSGFRGKKCPPRCSKVSLIQHITGSEYGARQAVYK